MTRLIFDRDGMVYVIVDSQLTSRFIERRGADGKVRAVPIDYHVATMREASAEEVEQWKAER